MLHVPQGLKQREARYGPPRYILLASIRTKVIDELLLKQLTGPKPSGDTEPKAVAEDGQTELAAHSTAIKQQVAHKLSNFHEACTDYQRVLTKYTFTIHRSHVMVVC